MTTPTTAVWLNRENYPTFKRLMPGDPYLCDTFDEWLETATEQIAKLKSNGITVEKIIPEPQKFAAYCKATGQKPNGIMLMGFCVAESYRRKL